MRHVPLDHMSFIVVQHLAPDHESILTQLLARTSRLTVQTAVDGAILEPNHVYVIPPNVQLAVLNGVVRVMPQTGAYGPRQPIDYLFRSLAEDLGHAAIGIIM
jgi:two-component system CheB/CheR fusion protein